MSLAALPPGRGGAAERAAAAGHPAGSGRFATPQRRAGGPTFLALRTVADGLVEASAGGRVIGYIETAGDVFVVLQGARYSEAVEVGQTLLIQRATAILAGSFDELSGGARGPQP